MRFSARGARTAVTIVTGLIATSAFAYWGYAELRAHHFRQEVAAWVKDASERMDAALSTDFSRGPPGAAQLLDFYDHAEVVDAHFRRLRTEHFEGAAPLAEAADDYLLTSREILLRWASSHRHRARLSQSIRALQDHMQSDDGSAGWVSRAIRVKEQVEEDYRDYQRSVAALGTLLAGFPAARDKIAPHLDAELLADGRIVASARVRALAVSSLAAGEIERVRQLRTYR